MIENCDRIMHLRFSFDACPLHSPFGFMHVMPVCQMNTNFNQTAGQVAHKSNPSCVVRATDIAMEAYNNSH